MPTIRRGGRLRLLVQHYHKPPALLPEVGEPVGLGRLGLAFMGGRRARKRSSKVRNSPREVLLLNLLPVQLVSLLRLMLHLQLSHKIGPDDPDGHGKHDQPREHGNGGKDLSYCSGGHHITEPHRGGSHHNPPHAGRDGVERRTLPMGSPEIQTPVPRLSRGAGGPGGMHKQRASRLPCAHLTKINESGKYNNPYTNLKQEHIQRRQ
mmetsp:Transcript_87860/g.200754  ORF Transcript_87860/g.200754 Transcript_87860/m.200754 type:complete len:207 (-) Transcript_87860:1140-1760(-)